MWIDFLIQTWSCARKKYAQSQQMTPNFPVPLQGQNKNH